MKKLVIMLSILILISSACSTLMMQRYNDMLEQEQEQRSI